MTLPTWLRRTWRKLYRCSVLYMLLACATAAQANMIFRDDFDDDLAPAPQVHIVRDDRVATLEMDYDAENAWGQWWTMTGRGEDDAGFLVTWWPLGAGAAAVDGVSLHAGAGCNGCLDACGGAMKSGSDARWLVTGNRRVQLQPLLNGAPYYVRIERIDGFGRISSRARVLTFDGGDAARVAALRTQMTHFDDFNLAAGAADETRWNNATAVATDPRFNLFFINDQYHAHTLHGTNREHTGDKSQTSQRFRKPVRIEHGARRRIVFDMDTPLSPRSVWYLDLNPVATDLTGHADFFDQEGATGLPAGMLRLRAAGQHFSVNLIDLHGASHPIASVDMEAHGRQAVSNVRRAFEARVGTDGIQVLVDGRMLIDTAFAPHSFRAGDYELLWIGFGYNTNKDANPYYLLHWDNFGFDGPDVEPRTVHNYVTRIAGGDYRKANRSSGLFPTFTVQIPDDLRPAIDGATAQAWLVLTYQMNDYSPLQLVAGDHVRLNGTASFTLPAPLNNSEPQDAQLSAWGMPHTVRVKLADLVRGGSSPLSIGDNALQFFVENSGILNVHIEVLYPPGSAPAYTPPAAIHSFPLHAQLPRLGPPARFERIGNTPVGAQHLIGANPGARIGISGEVVLSMTVGNRSYADWAPQLMVFPVQSIEVWSTGGTQGIAQVEVFLRRAGSGAVPGERVILLDTARHAPTPQGRYTVSFDTRGFANGDYELFVQATTPTGVKSHPSYGDEAERWDAAELSGKYYPIPVTLQN